MTADTLDTESPVRSFRKSLPLALIRFACSWRSQRRHCHGQQRSECQLWWTTLERLLHLVDPSVASFHRRCVVFIPFLQLRADSRPRQTEPTLLDRLCKPNSSPRPSSSSSARSPDRSSLSDSSPTLSTTRPLLSARQLSFRQETLLSTLPLPLRLGFLLRFISSLFVQSPKLTISLQPPSAVNDGIINGYNDALPNPMAFIANEWCSNGERSNAWLLLTWEQPVLITSVILYDRPNLYEYDFPLEFSKRNR